MLQERTFLKRLQQDLFPRMKRKNSLKKIASGQQWDGTSSFMEHYRLVAGRVQCIGRDCTGRGAMHRKTLVLVVGV